jgi:hAT family protein
VYFVLDVFVIPMMFAECERVLFECKNLVTDSRNRLNPDIIEANECFKHWLGKPEEQESGSDQEKTEADQATTTLKTKNENESDTEDGVLLVSFMSLCAGVLQNGN